MEERKASALINLSRMVHNLEFMCLKEQEKISQKSYTNFSMHEILKPSFGLTSNYDYDSDSAYTSDNWDASSSSDEALDRLSVRSQSPEEAITYSVIQSQRVRKNGCTTAPRATVKPKNELMTSWTQRWRQKFEDDGYSSSDSESALDLRIERKKTPPKLTSQIPAWVFCTRYSDRPSAGKTLLIYIVLSMMMIIIITVVDEVAVGLGGISNKLAIDFIIMLILQIVF